MRKLFGIPVGTFSTVVVVALALVLGVMLTLAIRHPVFFKLGLRNGIRRRARTAVIVVGLMLGTAIITSALSTGDTMSRTIRSSVIHSYGWTDEVVSVRTAETTVAVAFGSSSDLGFFSESAYTSVQARLDGSDLIDGVAPAISEIVAAQNVTRQANEPRLTFFATDPARQRGFGAITDTQGRRASLRDLRAGEVYLDSEAADRLDARAGDQLTIFTGTQLLDTRVRAIVDFDGSGSDKGAVLVSLDAAQALLGREGEINQILVSNAGDALSGVTKTDAVRDVLRPVLRPLGLEARPVKSDGLDAADAQGDAFMTLFSTFGMFTIAAGILLIFLIFVMLAAERRSEMGTARALGMQRRHLVEVFLYEGVAYDLIAAAIGTALGIGIAYGMVEAVAQAFDPGGDGFEIVHGLSFSSVAISYGLGVLLTFAVVSFSAWRVSVLNIVTAIRNLPEPRRPGRGRRHLLGGVALMVLGVGMLVSGAGSKQALPFLVGGSVVVVALVVLARAANLRPRLVYTIGGVGLVVWWLLPFSVFRSLVPGLSMNYSVWVTGGLIVVLGTTWTIIFNADLLNRATDAVFGRIRRFAPVLRTSLAYPLRNRFRTGTTIALFTLVVFTLVVGATTSDAFNRALNDETNFGGGFQVRAELAPTGAARDPAAMVAGARGLDTTGIRVVAGQSFVPVEARQSGPGAPAFEDYPLRGLDDAFLRSTQFGLAARAKGYESDSAVWRAMRDTEGLAVVDALVVPRRDNWYVGALPDFRLRGFVLEDETFDPVPVHVRDPQTGAITPLTVIGVLKDSAPLAMAGLSTSQATLAPLGDRALPTALYIKVAPGTDPDRTATQLEHAFLAQGMQAESIRSVLDDLVSSSRTVQRIVLGFLGLGLVIGVAALGVISARSVVERRQQIGVLRAIGFQRGMVQMSFLLESSLIALAGIVLGTVLGVVMAHNIVADSGSQPSWSNITFQLPWAMLGIVYATVYAAALVASFVPARRASRVYPAAALRYQ